DRIALHPLGVRPRPRVLRLERGGERGDGLVIGTLDQVTLAALDLEQMPEVARVEQELLLRLALLRRSERNPVQAAREPFHDRQQLERAERLAQERIGA